MNKRIYSLVCIALYTLLVVSIHCSEQKVSDVGYTSGLGTKEINKNNETDGIEYKNETQLKNNNPKDDTYDEDDKDNKGFSFFNIFKRNKKNKKIKTSSYSKVSLTHPDKKIIEELLNKNEYLYKVLLLMRKFMRDLLVKNSDPLNFLSDNKITETYLKNNEYLSNELLQLQKNVQDILEKNPRLLKSLLQLTEKLENTFQIIN
ncbi:fam-c protein [Plasmodium yoelii yoelii]|uniref:Fam-c protein n=1 Tax=Plasmodium yoelii yoelii TaxID=73239 RepID=A0AAE9WTE2_PLAYO|nr:fam-c protein [Plasmodium yoelii yoelii]